jgi:hypothetical protein
MDGGLGPGVGDLPGREKRASKSQAVGRARGEGTRADGLLFEETLGRAGEESNGIHDEKLDRFVSLSQSSTLTDL